MNKIILPILFAFALMNTAQGAVCYSISSSGNELQISVVADQDYIAAPDYFWVTGNVTLSWPATLGAGVIASTSGQNGFGFAADGPAYLNGGSYYQKFGFTTRPPVVQPLTTGIPVLVMTAVVSHPSEPVGDFSIVEIPGTPPVNARASFSNVLSEQFGGNNCTLTTSSVALPIELLQFEAQAQTDRIGLNWTVGTEKTVTAYELERSTDGQQFSGIVRINARQQGTATERYTYDDRTVVANVQYYYRLKILEENGQFSYSGIRIAQINGRKTITFMPNPANNLIYINWQDNEVTNMAVVDMQGRQVLSIPVPLHTLSVADLPTGVYLVRFDCADAPPQFVRLIKN